MALTRSQSAAESIVEPTAQTQDTDSLEQTLRPKQLQEYIGQAKTKEHLQIHIAAARNRNEPLGHILLHGPPGLGKTTLANIIAHEMNTNIRTTSGPAIEKPGDVASLLTNLEKGDVLFIDEIHRLRPAVEEVLYSAMEDYMLDIVIGKGPTARSVRLNVQPFTLIGATTKAGSVSAPLRDRFMHHFKLGFYEPTEMRQIVDRSARILGITLGAGAAERIASSSRFTPRIANRLVRAVRDFTHAKNEDEANMIRVEDTLSSLDIDTEGLDATDRLLLKTIVESFNGGPVGLGTLAAILAEEEETIEDVHEPFLMQQGYIQRTPKGRTATKKAYERLGKEMPGQSTIF